MSGIFPDHRVPSSRNPLAVTACRTASRDRHPRRWGLRGVQA